MEKLQVSEREFFNKVIEANAVIAEDGIIQTIYGYFAIVNIPNDESKLATFLHNVYGAEADAVVPPKSGWYFVTKDTKDGEDSVITVGYADEIEWAFRQEQENYTKAIERKAEIDSWKSKRFSEV